MEFGAEIRLGSGNAAQLVDGVMVVNRPVPPQRYKLVARHKDGGEITAIADGHEAVMRQFEGDKENGGVGGLALCGYQIVLLEPMQ